VSSRITIEDVAALARVSIKTVSRVLNDEPNVQISTRQRVTEAINRLNFRPSRVARSLAARRTFILGLMYDNPCAHYVAKLQAGALRACASEGYDLLVLPRSYLNTDTASEIASLYRQSRFDGVILSPPLSDVTSLVQGLRQERVPLTLISPGGALVESSSVHTNDQEAARLMTEYLISMGHRDIAFVAGHPDHMAVCTRTAGFLEAMQAAGLSVPDDFVYAGLNSFESGEQDGAALLAKP
jgi:LacI family transcriptional regulator